MLRVAAVEDTSPHYFDHNKKMISLAGDFIVVGNLLKTRVSVKYNLKRTPKNESKRNVKLFLESQILKKKKK